MRLTDLNPLPELGANCLLIELGPFRLLMDCGINPRHSGTRALPELGLLRDNSIDFVLLTHTHLDHLGALPIVLRHQQYCQVIVSLATQTLAPRMMFNSYNVMLRQREELGLPELPLFTPREIRATEDRFMPMRYNRPRLLEKDGETLQLTLHHAGHIPGAYGFVLEYKHRRILFTGDMLLRDQLTLPGADFPREKIDTLVVETTRGATPTTTRHDRTDEIERLIATLAQTLEQGGSALIPVFALGRTQEILAILHQARARKQLPPCPIFSSGLGMALVDDFDLIARKHGDTRFRSSMVKDLRVRPLQSDPVAGEPLREAGLYILSSGMMVENTPSYIAAASLIEQPENTVCFVGYCDPDTPGGQLQAAKPGDILPFRTLHYNAHLRASVERFDLSGHADREQTLDLITQLAPRAIVLTHGDPAARQWFESALYENPFTCGAKILSPQPLTPHDI